MLEILKTVISKKNSQFLAKYKKYTTMLTKIEALFFFNYLCLHF